MTHPRNPQERTHTTMADYAYVGIIAETIRMDNSQNGNPRYRVNFRDGESMTTAPDASIAYGIPNPEFKNVRVGITRNERGQITNAVPLPDSKERRPGTR